MQQKRFIAQFLLGVAILFASIFQLFHSYEHFVDATDYEHKHSTHEHYTESRNDFTGKTEWKEDHGFLDKCFECDFIVTNYLLPEVTALAVPLAFYFNEIVLISAQREFTSFYYSYSLRGPPVFVC